MSAAILPSTSDREAWTADESAVIEAAGLVFIHSYGESKGKKILAPRPIVAKFLHTCERTGLDPLARQIYCIGRFGRDGLEWSVQTSIDGFRVIAERSRQYAGQDAAEWLTAKGEWVPVFIKEVHGDHPFAARVRVWRHDWPDRPMTAVATWEEYAQTTSKGELTSMWRQRGPGQLAKCAEALALRKAFPQDLSGLYTDEEMDSQPVEVAEGDEVPRRRALPTLASRARAAAQSADEQPDVAGSAEPAEDAADETTEPAAVASEVGVAPKTTGGGATAEEDHLRATGAPAGSVSGPTDRDEVELFPCSRCGRPVVEDDGGICEPCEIEIEAEIAAGEEQS